MQYLLHRIFNWDFDGMSLEVRSELSGVVTNARISFSIFRYLPSAPLRARLQ